MKNILKSKLKSLHFSIILSIAVLSCSFLWFIGIPVFYFLTLGSGEVGTKIGEKPFHIFISDWGALIIILVLCSIGIINNYKKQQLGNAKSYLLTFLITSILYVLKVQIAELIVGLFS